MLVYSFVRNTYDIYFYSTFLFISIEGLLLILIHSTMSYVFIEIMLAPNTILAWQLESSSWTRSWSSRRWPNERHRNLKLFHNHSNKCTRLSMESANTFGAEITSSVFTHRKNENYARLKIKINQSSIIIICILLIIILYWYYILHNNNNIYHHYLLFL